MEGTSQAIVDRIKAELPDYGFNDYLRALASMDGSSSNGKPLRLAILRSYTLEAIEPVLKLRLLIEGFRPTFWIGGYNQYVQEIIDPASGLHAFEPDVVLLMVRLEEVMPDFLADFGSLPASEWERRVTDRARELAGLAARVQSSLAAQVVVQGMTLSAEPYFGVFDAQRSDGQGALVHRFNQTLADELSRVSGAFLWDFDAFTRRQGHAQLVDPKMWYVARNPYRQSAYPAIADDLLRYVRSALGVMKKCIVLDLDNTLWGGIAGEDGLEGIRLGHTYPGNCYRDFQRELLKLQQRGILLAINSKNNEADALQIIDNHPDMILRREHFAATRINWQDKAANLREIANELNIGVDSFVMIDDNPVECELLRRECPMCEVVQLPTKPYLIPAVPSSIPGVQNIRLTPEDRRKSEMYRARSERKAQQGEFTDLAEFLRGLEIEVAIEDAAPFSIPRIAQLTQKTNQLNVTTRRYTEAQIQAFAADPGFAVYSVASKDRFGDDGIVGVIILAFENDECRIDTLLLSCRVIGRGIEQLMVAFAAEVARQRGALMLVGEFIPTAKNHPAAGLFEQCGLRATSDTLFRAEVTAGTFVAPAHIRVKSESFTLASQPAAAVQE